MKRFLLFSFLYFSFIIPIIGQQIISLEIKKSVKTLKSIAKDVNLHTKENQQLSNNNEERKISKSRLANLNVIQTISSMDDQQLIKITTEIRAALNENPKQFLQILRDDTNKMKKDPNFTNQNSIELTRTRAIIEEEVAERWGYKFSTMAFIPYLVKLEIISTSLESFKLPEGDMGVPKMVVKAKVLEVVSGSSNILNSDIEFYYLPRFTKFDEPLIDGEVYFSQIGIQTDNVAEISLYMRPITEHYPMLKIINGEIFDKDNYFEWGLCLSWEEFREKFSGAYNFKH